MKAFRILIWLTAFLLMGMMAQGQSILYSENFETSSLPDSVTHLGTGQWGKSATLFSQGNRSDSMRIVSSGDSVVMTSQTFSTLGLFSVLFQFDHICKIEFLDEGYIEVSGDNGLTWSRLTGAQYQGSGQFGAQGNRFNAASYNNDWAAGFFTTPTNAWWKSETFDISQLVSNAMNVKIRFVLKDANPGSTFPDNYAWLIDNISVIGAYSELIPPVITMIPPIQQDTLYTATPYLIKAKITDASGVDTAYLIYNVTPGTSDSLGMAKISPDTFQCLIPFFGFGRTIHYRIVAIDLSPAQNYAVDPFTGTRMFYAKHGNGGVYEIGTGANSSTQYGPAYIIAAGSTINSSRYQYLITNDELAAAGISSGGAISKLEWFKTDPNQSLGNSSFKIYLKNSNQTVLGSSAGWSSILNGATEVYNNPMTQIPSPIGWVPFNLQNFNYHGGGLEVVTDWDNSMVGTPQATGIIQWRYTSGLPGTRTIGKPGSNPDTTLFSTYGGNLRPNIRITFHSSGAVQTDAGIAQIINPSGSINAGVPTNAIVQIRNFGADTLSTTTINWSLDGTVQTPFSFNGQLLKDSLSGPIILGNMTLMAGIHTIKAWTSNPNGQTDLNLANDSISLTFVACPGQLAGNYTIGGSNPSFNTWSEALFVLQQCGISGPVTFSIASGIYQEQIRVLPVPGASASNTITFTSSAYDSTAVTITYQAPNSSENFIIKVDGAQYITFRNIGILPVDPTNATAVQLVNGASHNRFIGCYFIGKTGMSDELILVRSEDPGNTDNIIEGNRFENGSTAVSLMGSSLSSMQTGGIIRNNVFHEFYVSGIRAGYVQDVLIDSNIVFATGSNSGLRTGISLDHFQGNTQVTKNRISLSGSDQTSGILLQNGLKMANLHGLVANNFVSISNGTNAMAGIKVSNSNAQKIISNSLNIQGTALYFTCGINTSTGSSDIIVLNNNISTNFYPTLYEGTSCSKSDYNNLFSSSSLWGYFGSSLFNFSSFDAYRDSTKLDSNSVAISSGFASSTDLHTTQFGLKGRALSVPEVTTDIDGSMRNVVAPTIGADELPDFANDLFLMQLLRPVDGCGLSSADTVTVRVANAGTQTVPSGFVLHYQVIGSPVVVSETVNQPLSPGNVLDHHFNNTINLTPGSLHQDTTFQIKAWATYAADQFHQNDTLHKKVISGYTPAAPLVSPQTTPYGSALTLTAISADTLAWFTSDTASVPAYTGKYFTTPVLYSNMNYWISAISLQGLKCESARIPLAVTVTNIPAIDAGITVIVNPSGDIPAKTSHPLLVRLKNFGAQPLLSAGITYSLNGVTNDTVQWTGNLPQGSEVDVTLDTLILPTGSYNLKTWSILPNGTTDPFTSNDTASLNFVACLAGVYTLGPVGGTTTYDFNTFASAVSVMQTAGICGDITILVADGIYNEQLTITPILGAGPNARITFASASGDSTAVTLKYTLSATVQWAIKLNGADYITFRHMKLSVLGSTGYGRVFHFESGANHNIIENCILEGVNAANTGFNFANIFISGGVNEYNIFRNNRFLHGGQSLHYVGGSASGRAKGTLIEGNIFENYYYLGVMASYHDSVQITGNKFLPSNGNTFGYGILTSYCINESRILKNTIQASNPGYFYGIHVSNWTSIATKRSLIANNFVSITAGTGTSYGIYIYNTAYSEVYFNTVNVLGTGVLARSAFLLQVTALNFRNNILRANLGYAINFSGTSTIEACDYNNLTSNGAYIANINSLDYASFNAYRAAATWDQHSWSILPAFISNTDLHLQNTQLSGKGQYISAVPDDIDGETRSPMPAIGADEVPLPATDASISQIILPGSVLQEFDTITPQVVLCNMGTDTLFVVPVAYTTNNGTPVFYNYVDTLAPFMCDTVILPSFICPAGSSTFCAYTQAIGDSSTYNDTVCTNFFGNTAYDAAIVRMVPIPGGCGLTTDSVKIVIRNEGGLSISGNLMASYKVAGGSTVVSQPVPGTIIPGDSLLFSFSVPVSLAVTAADSLFNIQVWINLPLDNVHYNDSISLIVKSLLMPSTPTVVHATVPYGTQASVTATSSSGSILRWYDSPTGGNLLHQGAVYITPNIYANDTVWVEASGGFQGSTLTVGTGTGLNSPTSWPSPYGNNFWGNKEQYLITAAELTSMGVSDGPITMLGFQVAAVNACPALSNYTIRMAHTTANAIFVWAPETFTTVYSVPVYQPVHGWNQHHFINPFLWDGVQNVIVEVCFNNTSFTSSGNASVFFTTTPVNTVVRYGGDNPVVCSAPLYPNVLANRPNMQLKFEATGCTSSRVPLYITATSQPSADVGVTTIIQPATNAGLTTQEPVMVTVRNYGSAAQSNIPVSFRVNNQPVITETIPGTIPAGDSNVYTFISKADLSSSGNFYQISAYTGLTGDAFLQNDSSSLMIQHLLPDPCLSGATSTANEEITQVVLHTLNSVSAPTGATYSDFTSTVPAPLLQPGASYPLSIKSSFTTGYTTQYSCFVKAWIDFNQDSLFDINNEEVFASLTKSDTTIAGVLTIPFTAVSGNTRMRIVLNQTTQSYLVAPCGGYTYGETEDYIVTIAPPASCDAGLLEIIDPVEPSYSGSPVSVYVKFANFGSDTIQPNTLSLVYTLNNGTPIVTPYSGTLLPMSVDSMYLPAVVLNIGINSFCVSTSLSCDTNFNNDEICKTITGQLYTGLPYLDDFESGSYWFTPDASSNWQYGTPAANIINTAHSGTKAWVTNLTGDYSNNVNEWLYSPCFDFSLPGFPDTITLSFYHWVDMANGDFGNVEYSLNGGSNWVNLGFSGDPLGVNWYNTQLGGVHCFSLVNSGWQYSAHKLQPSTFNGQDSVQFRFHFSSNAAATANGWAIDDFKLAFPQYPEDAGITTINYPMNDTAAGSFINAEVTLKNFGTDPLSLIPLVLKINGISVAQENFTGNLLPDSSTSYTFSTAYTVPGSPFQLCAATVLSGDPAAFNDATCRNYGALPPLNDVGISQILAPAPGNVGLYNPAVAHFYMYDVVVRLKNFGQQTQTTVPVKYTFFNGGTAYNQTWSGNLLPGDSADFTLNEKFKPYLGPQVVCVYTVLSGDLITQNDSSCSSYNGIITGIDDQSGSSLKVYPAIPNPASAITSIRIILPSEGVLKFTLLNHMGQEVMHDGSRFMAGEHKLEVDISGYAKGVYQYCIEFKGERITGKLVVVN